MPRRSASGSTRAGSRLSRETIVSAAVELADREGLNALSMRRLAQQLGVDAMSTYYHLPDKNALLTAMADAVVAEIVPPPPTDAPWTEELRALITAARSTVSRHPWAAHILEQRQEPSPAVMLHIERVLAVMRRGGCSVALGHHAIHLLGSRILGFSQDLFDDKAAPAPPPERIEQWATAMPHIAELAAQVSHQGPLGGCDDDEEFAFALDVLLEGLERRRT
ncbi:TetR/AcrR family transcriptional regulator [Actinoplanes sp. NPDC049265]|uniref:TetR/AcrR family transcriptional regulator n=1 Tax=Actinoplanes sp. NPDC049265 TaxID=3363902 RepID=UPI003716E608